MVWILINCLGYHNVFLQRWYGTSYHESTIDVKCVKKHALIQEYKLFRMQQGETIADVYKKFTHIVNHLISLGKVFNREELNMKILKCFDRNWQPKALPSQNNVTSPSSSWKEDEEINHELHDTYKNSAGENETNELKRLRLET